MTHLGGTSARLLEARATARISKVYPSFSAHER
jgi:hypothetical protein